ncbi:hypothetical protein H1R20_g10891, partial [Candolleomyces eurysporus]
MAGGTVTFGRNNLRLTASFDLSRYNLDALAGPAAPEVTAARVLVATALLRTLEAFFVLAVFFPT